MFVEEINLEEELATGLMLPSTESSYNTYIRCFMEFLHEEVVQDFSQVPLHVLTDDNIAKVLLFFEKKHNFRLGLLKQRMNIHFAFWEHVQV